MISRGWDSRIPRDVRISELESFPPFLSKISAKGQLAWPYIPLGDRAPAPSEGTLLIQLNLTPSRCLSSGPAPQGPEGQVPPPPATPQIMAGTPDSFPLGSTPHPLPYWLYLSWF